MRRALGKHQADLLAILRERGAWDAKRPGWAWLNRYETKRILDSLVRRGLVLRNGDEYRPREDQ